MQLQRERVVIPNTPPSTAAVKGKRRGSRGAYTKKEVGGESCEEKEQNGGGYCSVHYNDRPLAASVQSIDTQRSFCADIIANQL